MDLRTLIAAILILLSVNAQSEELSSEDLKNLGAQLFESLIRGEELPAERRVYTDGCLVSFDENLPNVYLGTNGLDFETPKKQRFRKLGAYQLVDQEVILSSQELEDDSLSFDFNQFGEFLFRFKVKTKGRYLSCKRGFNPESLNTCDKFRLRRKKDRAFTFEIIASIMQPQPGDALDEQDIPMMVGLGSIVPEKIGVVKKKCYKRR